MKTWKSLFAFILLPSFLLSQVDTILNIPEVEVRAERIDKNILKGFVQKIDSQELSLHAPSNLTSLLTNQGGIFFKTYGLGSLATSALRGTGAGHTTLLWNGFNLQNPMNGNIDFSLFPVWLTDEVSVQHGGGSTLQGSGSIGGSVLLKNKMPESAGWQGEAGASAGSFDSFRQFAKAAFGSETFKADLRLFHEAAENDFFIPALDKRLENAALQQWAVSQNNLVKINERQQIKTFGWWQKVKREIPPSRTESNAHARQDDEVLRLGAEWQRLGISSVTKARAGYFDEEVFFLSDVIDSSRSHSNTYVAEAEQAFFLKNEQTLRIGLHFIRQEASTRETGAQERSRFALFAAWERSFLSNKINWSLDARQELADGALIPFVASTGATFQLNEKWSLHSRISKNFNLPTFNAFYWQDPFAQGNPNLKPETALGEDLGIRFHQKQYRKEFDAHLALFNNVVQNWILWSPVGGGIWKPDNKRRVWARGIETTVEYTRRAGYWQFATSGNASVTRSTVVKIYRDDNPDFLGKQLIYTPVLNSTLNFSAFYKNGFLSYNHQFTGKRYTTTDNREEDATPSYHVASLAFGQVVSIKKVQARFQLIIENLWNTEYEVVPARPMPGRYFSLECRFGWNK